MIRPSPADFRFWILEFGLRKTSVVRRQLSVVENELMGTSIFQFGASNSECLAIRVLDGITGAGGKGDA